MDGDLLQKSSHNAEVGGSSPPVATKTNNQAREIVGFLLLTQNVKTAILVAAVWQWYRQRCYGADHYGAA